MAKQRMIVVGGGVMGLATGCALAAEADVEVTVLERFEVGHEWASSHGLTRAIRHEYGDAVIYTDMVARSLPLWDTLARETGRALYTETGVLTLGQPDDGHTLPGLEVMRAHGLPVERLSADQCRERFPQFRVDEYQAITWNPTGGMLHASECLIALSERFTARGGILREGAHVARIEPTSAGGTVTLADGAQLTADRVVVTTGPWVHDVLPDLNLPVRPTRQQVCYFADLPAPDMFAVGRFPVFLVGMNQYGFPLQGPGWLKVGLHTFGETADPNAGYEPDTSAVEGVRDFLRRAIPDAADARLAGIDRCMYDITPDEDFILDAHPGGSGVIIGSGFSGHGFKFGVLIGEMLAALARDVPSPIPLDRFRLSRFASRPAVSE
ncbi:MAG TPA: N-methyl-L-tryptophan oxidase [Ktedonobacterales bacterium]|nr:N-methyl-L-tryptophan oxidase [Ktedonobacterales bacterium]